MVEWFDLNARHQAAFVWGSIALLILGVKFPDIRNSVRGLLMAFFKPVIFLSVMGLFLTTAVVSAAGFSVGRGLGAFDIAPVFTSIVWSCTSGVSLMAAKLVPGKRTGSVQRALTKTLAPAAILSILLNFAVMGIWWEIGTFPFVTAFGIVAVWASLREEFAGAARLSNAVLAVWGLVMLLRTVHSLIGDRDAWIALVESISYPVWLTVGAIPYVYLVAQYDKLRFVLGRKTRQITAAEFGDRWPLTVDTAKLCCRHSAVWVEVSRKKYCLNGTSIGLLQRYGFTTHELEDIWKPHPEFEGLKVSTFPLIQDGLKLEMTD
ncbi:MAG: DUF2511 domain-containing protein [bacterium]|nr:DUF2511 domain-containing protein [bacterium]MDE0601379.1 DUF2511 domain-containing protein [bacterium]